MSDPFRHHPELAGKITDPEQSFFRDFTKDKLVAMLAEKGVDAPNFHEDDARETIRRDALSEAPRGDLWVFGYGSLMWDPAFYFAEVRRAWVDGYSRRFILKDTYGGRGTEEQPGAMAALDVGEGCNGLIFRISEDMIERETEILCRRELLGPAYTPTYHIAETDHGPETTLMFVADHSSDSIVPDLTHDLQVEYLATGTGFLGTSADYLRGIVEKFEQLGIEDPETEALLRDVEARICRS